MSINRRLFARAGGALIVGSALAAGCAPEAMAATEPLPADTAQVLTPADPALETSDGLTVANDGVSYWTSQSAAWYARNPKQPPSVWLLGPDGSTSAVVTLNGVDLRQTEDLATGPGPGGQDYVYVADTGTTTGSPRSSKQAPVDRREFSIYRFPAPPITAEPTTARSSLTPQRLRFRYPDDKSHAAKGVLVDPRSGDVLLIERAATTTNSPVWQVNGVWDSPIPTVATATSAMVPLAVATSGTVDPQRRFLSVRGGKESLLYRVPADGSLVDALHDQPTQLQLPTSTTGEAIAVSPQGDGVDLGASGSQNPIVRVPLPDRFRASLATSDPAGQQGVWLSDVALRISILTAIGAATLVIAWLILRARRRGADEVIDLRASPHSSRQPEPSTPSHDD
ncbi:MAG: hypothetical protein ACOYD0_04170 [Candidatus Nanopelagicales bacterium]